MTKQITAVQTETLDISIATSKAVAKACKAWDKQATSFSKGFIKIGLTLLTSMNPEKADALYTIDAIKKMVKDDDNGHHDKLASKMRMTIAFFTKADTKQKKVIVESLDGASNFSTTINYLYKSGMVSKHGALLKTQKLLDNSQASVKRIPAELKKSNPAVALAYNPECLTTKEIVKLADEIETDLENVAVKSRASAVKSVVKKAITEIAEQSAKKAEKIDGKNDNVIDKPQVQSKDETEAEKALRAYKVQDANIRNAHKLAEKLAKDMPDNDDVLGLKALMQAIVNHQDAVA